MLRLTLDETTLRTTRIATSPLWECVASLTMLVRYRGGPPSPYASWAHAVRRAMSAEEFRQLLLAGREVTTWRQTRPWVPVPDAAHPTFETEIEHWADVQKHDEQTPKMLEILRLHWNRSVAPWWPAMRVTLDQEVTARGRDLALAGPERMLAELGGRLEWRAPTLTAPFQSDLQLVIQNSRLVLVPMIFAGGLRIFSRRSDAVAALCYQSQALGLPTGVAGSARSPAPETDRLGLLVGRPRARVMQALVVPTTTKALAASLGLAASTVSQHLAQLTAVGVVRRTTVDGRVLYELDRSGFALLQEFGA